jgi:hypothetical protein
MRPLCRSYMTGRHKTGIVGAKMGHWYSTMTKMDGIFTCWILALREAQQTTISAQEALQLIVRGAESRMNDLCRAVNCRNSTLDSEFSSSTKYK